MSRKSQWMIFTAMNAFNNLYRWNSGFSRHYSYMFCSKHLKNCKKRRSGLNWEVLQCMKQAVYCSIEVILNQWKLSAQYTFTSKQCQFLRSCLHQTKPNQMPTNSSRCRQPWINVKSVCGLRFCAKTTSLKKPPCSIIGFQRFSPLHPGSLTTPVAYLADKKYFLPCINHSTIEKSLPT